MESQEVEKNENESGNFVLPIGFEIGGKQVLTLPIAETGSEAEKIFTTKPKQGKAHTWFGKIISTSVSQINDEPIASVYNKQEDKNIIPELVRMIPFLDAGSLLIQIQRACWEDTITDQKLTCINCSEKLTANIELNNIKVPVNETGKAISQYTVKLKVPHVIRTGLDILEEYEGYKINRLVFKTTSLGDAINHEGVAKDEVQFWRNIAFDTLKEIYFEDANGEITQVPNGFIQKRGKAFFSNDLDSKKLKEIRTGMQNTQPSVKTYYDEACPSCGEDTPFFASVSHFFQV